MMSEQPQPLPERQPGRSPTPWRSWVKLLGPILGLTAVGVVFAVAILGLLTLAAWIFFTVWFGGSGGFGSNK